MKATTTEFEIKVSDGSRIIETNGNLEDGKCKLILELSPSDEFIIEVKKLVSDDNFIFCNLSELSVEDEFLKYEPLSIRNPKIRDERIDILIGRQLTLKAELLKVIKYGLKDIWCPKCDPSFTDETHTEIQFKQGVKPEVGKAFEWRWTEIAEKFCPERGSRLGKKCEYIGFRGWLIKKLIENGWTREDAWYKVCSASEDLEHYSDLETYEYNFENTGSREICGIIDSLNTYKILEDGQWLAGENKKDFGNFFHLNNLGYFYHRYEDFCNSVGWVVLVKKNERV